MTVPFTYLILLVLLVQSVCLDGAAEGLAKLATPDLNALYEETIWIRAADQVGMKIKYLERATMNGSSLRRTRGHCHSLW